MPGMERRHSTSSEDANLPPQRQLSQDGTEIIPTRMSKVTTPKPASNPLQFIKIGPCDLYKAAQEQIKKVEEIKKVEKVKDDSEDWQSNLDNWKCSRRKRQEHIIERVVEVKKLELEEHDRNRRRSKTFNEMMEERSSKGGLRKMSILSFSEEDSNDLSDLGITTSNKEKSGGDYTNDQMENGSNNHHSNNNSGNDESGSNNSNDQNSTGYDGGSSTPATISSPEPEEYTYERAIQSYMNFAEAKVKAPIKIPAEKSVNGKVNFRICAMRKEPEGKIGEKLSELEQIRLRSKSTNDISGGNEAKHLPKVDVLKRRSLFENVEAADTIAVKSSDRMPKDLSNTTIVKERLSNLEKSNDTAPKMNRSFGEIAPNIKETISNLEKQKTVNGSSQANKRLSNGDVPPQISIKERLNSLEKQNVEDGFGKSLPFDSVSPTSPKDKTSSYDEDTGKDSITKIESERDAGFKEKLGTFKLTEINQNEVVNSITENSSNICSDNAQKIVKPLARFEKKSGEEKPIMVSTENALASGTEESMSQLSITNQMNTKSSTQTFEPVSSEEETLTACNKWVMVASAKEEEKSLERPKESETEKVKEDETDKMAEGVATVCQRMETNKQLVQGGQSESALTKIRDDIRTSSSQTDIPDSLESGRPEISKTIVTHISLPDTAVPCPRVNISVSFDSASKSAASSNSDDEAMDEFSDQVSRPQKSRITFNKPQTRVRKLTPMVPTQQVQSPTPLKTVCELQIIEEGENQDPTFEEERKTIAVHMNPGTFSGPSQQAENEVQETVCSKMSMEKEEEQPQQPTQALVTTPGGLLNDDDDEFPGDEQEESAMMYTDENIEEVLGKEDDEDEELETMVDEDHPEEVKIQKELNIFTPKDSSEVLVSLKPLELSEKPLPVCGNYENIFITNQMPQLCMSPDSDIYSTLSFPLGSRPTIEPPKEKPPPPPLDLSDDESSKPELPPKPSLRRLDSTKRIKKEIRKKRSDFLGIEGSNDDSYLEPEIYVAPPPDMMTFLQEERRLEQQLYRQSICSESDSNHETAESRDSGVELDRGHVDDICWSKPDVMSEPHSRQNSETFGNTSITSEEDEILKKEREIIEVLEKEEQWRYGNNNAHNPEQNDIGEKLAVKLRQLEQEKMQLERERAEEEDRRKAEESARRRNEQQLIAKQQQLRQQENSANTDSSSSSSSIPNSFEQEALRFERERLHKEQEHLERCRQNLMEQKQNPEPVDVHHRGNVSHWDTPSNRHSLQEVPIGLPMVDVPRHSMQDVSQPQYSSPMSSGYRYSLPDLQQRESRSTRPPPPIPPAKPVRPMTQEQWERETNIRNSRIPSADNIPLQIEASTKLRHGSSVPAININHGGQQMTRSTLHALSAAPRSRLINSENWMQPKRKVDAPKSNYNYQHWLIQEAEHRRILEHQQKMSQQLQSKRPPPAYNGQTPTAYGGSPPSHHTVGLPVSPPIQTQNNQKWVSPLRADKPLPDAVIQTLTQRVQSRENKTPLRRRTENLGGPLPNKMSPSTPDSHPTMNSSGQSQERMLSVSGKKKCSHCNEELGRGAAMIIESLRLFYHIDCFKCCVCHVQLGDGLMGTDVRVRNNKLHCHNCYSSDDASEPVPFVRGISDDKEPKDDDEGLVKVPGKILNDFSLLDSLVSGMNEEVLPDWFKEFYSVYLENETRKCKAFQEIFLRMIDFEIEKCELLKDIINKLKN